MQKKLIGLPHEYAPRITRITELNNKILKNCENAVEILFIY